MNILDRYANYIYRVATGDRRLKIAAIPLGVIIFFGIVLLFIFASLYLDGLLPWGHKDLSLGRLIVSLIVLIAGAVLMTWTVSSFFKVKGTPVPLCPPPKLVTGGLYRWIRNPMLLGLFLVMFGLGILLWSPFLFFVFTPLFIVINVVYLRNVEEKEMEKKFGEAYLRYKEEVPMFIPRLLRRKRDRST
jgi:protein-S-isoprenylcysteine O-methyltransferase Ste14